MNEIAFYRFLDVELNKVINKAKPVKSIEEFFLEEFLIRIEFSKLTIVKYLINFSGKAITP